jgi:hypothetical protein
MAVPLQGSIGGPVYHRSFRFENQTPATSAFNTFANGAMDCGILGTTAGDLLGCVRDELSIKRTDESLLTAGTKVGYLDSDAYFVNRLKAARAAISALSGITWTGRPEGLPQDFYKVQQIMTIIGVPSNRTTYRDIPELEMDPFKYDRLLNRQAMIGVEANATATNAVGVGYPNLTDLSSRSLEIQGLGTPPPAVFMGLDNTYAVIDSDGVVKGSSLRSLGCVAYGVKNQNDAETTPGKFLAGGGPRALMQANPESGWASVFANLDNRDMFIFAGFQSAASWPVRSMDWVRRLNVATASPSFWEADAVDYQFYMSPEDIGGEYLSWLSSETGIPAIR